MAGKETGATKDVEDAGGLSGSMGRNEEKKQGLGVKEGLTETGEGTVMQLHCHAQFCVQEFKDNVHRLKGANRASQKTAAIRKQAFSRRPNNNSCFKEGGGKKKKKVDLPICSRYSTDVFRGMIGHKDYSSPMTQIVPVILLETVKVLRCNIVNYLSTCIVY